MVTVNKADQETIMVVSENGYGKRSQVDDYRKTSRGAKGVKTLNITDKTGLLVAIKNVTDQNDLMIINKSGIVIRMSVAECRIMGRATQGVRLINLAKKNDVIASVCKVMNTELELAVEEESRSQWAQKNEDIQNDNATENFVDDELNGVDEDENLSENDSTSNDNVVENDEEK
jgi:DNA gyrase subunit A